ncbi:MAG: dTMP kinase [Candidatus Nealsonbacteria bacterium]|nr:MAG: dTMP kinase [Candidatus Nealsonbacteria bacterium]
MKANKYSGRFIVFEGLDGSGQSTQVKLLAEFLEKRGYKVLKTKEPTKDSVAGKKIAKILHKKEEVPPFEFQKLFSKDRAWHLKKIIIPALKERKIVISDRYFFSSFSYGITEGVELKELIALNKKFLLPDLVFFLDVSPEICIQRIGRRGKEKTLFEEKEILKKVYENYKKVLKEFEKTTKIFIINGERSIEEVFEDVKSRISTNLPRISRIS